MKIILTLLFISSLGGMAFATTLVQTKIACLDGNSGAMTFERLDTSLVKPSGVSVVFTFPKTCGYFALDHNCAIGKSVLFRHDIEAYMTSGTVNIVPSSMGNTLFERSQTNFTVGDVGDHIDAFDIGASDCSFCNAATKNTTFATENLDVDSWTNHVGRGTYDMDSRRFNCIAPRE